MVPPNVLAAIGLSLPELLASAPIAGDLMKALDIARDTGPAGGVFFRFANAFRQYSPAASWSDISQVYREAKGWAAVGNAVRGYPDQMPIDPNLYRPATTYGQYAGEYGGFITKVKVTITDPDTGNSRSYGVNIHDFLTWDVSDIGAYAIGSIEDVIGHSPTVGGATDLEGLDVTWEITDLLRII